MRKEIGGYTLLRRIGAGGMSAVYEAVDGAGVHVALKLLHPGVSADGQARARLRREVAAMQRIKSEYAAEIIDAEFDADEIFLVTELIEGITLEQDVRENGRFTEEDLASLGGQLDAALRSIHRAGVLHRDLKPANVMMRNNRPVLIDFGIAQLGDDSRLTRTGFVAQTPGYCDPRVIRGAAPDEAADRWALAAVLAYAATGSPPFGTGDPQVVLNRVLAGLVQGETGNSTLDEAFRRALSPRLEERLSFAALTEIIRNPEIPATRIIPVSGERTQILPEFTQPVPFRGDPARGSDAAETSWPQSSWPENAAADLSDAGDFPAADLPASDFPAGEREIKTLRRFPVLIFLCALTLAVFACVLGGKTNFAAGIGLCAAVALFFDFLGSLWLDMQVRRLRGGNQGRLGAVFSLLKSPYIFLGSVLRTAVNSVFALCCGYAALYALSLPETRLRFRDMAGFESRQAALLGALVFVSVQWGSPFAKKMRTGVRVLIRTLAPGIRYRLLWALVLTGVCAVGIRALNAGNFNIGVLNY